MGLRAALRERLVRVVDEVVSRHRRDQAAEQADRTVELLAAVDARRDAAVERVVAELRGIEIRDRRDTIAAAARAAVVSTAEFVQRELAAGSGRAQHDVGHPMAHRGACVTMARCSPTRCPWRSTRCGWLTITCTAR